MKTSIMLLIYASVVNAYSLLCGRIKNNQTNGNVTSRRFFFQKTFGMASASTFLLAPTQSSNAFGQEKPPITAENIAKYFGDVRVELESGGIAQIEEAINKADWEFLKDFTKSYDLEFRKAKMGLARAMMSDSKMKEDALALRNGVTFDLIAVNKAARVGDNEAAAKALQLLKSDITQFLAYENQIEIPPSVEE